MDIANQQELQMVGRIKQAAMTLVESVSTMVNGSL